MTWATSLTLAVVTGLVVGIAYDGPAPALVAAGVYAAAFLAGAAIVGRRAA